MITLKDFFYNDADVGGIRPRFEVGDRVVTAYDDPRNIFGTKDRIFTILEVRKKPDRYEEVRRADPKRWPGGYIVEGYQKIPGSFEYKLDDNKWILGRDLVLYSKRSETT